jgi:predicted O-methyltransferase YrrM
VISFHQVTSFVNHWLDQTNEHGIHSPFFFDFYRKVLRGPKPLTPFTAGIEQLRAKLLKNKSQVHMHDLGAGSAYTKAALRTVADIARQSATPAKLAQLYQRIAISAGAKKIIELGTNLGLTTLYLADKEDTRVYTLEGSPALANIAQLHFDFFAKKNITLMEGDIDATLPELLQSPEKLGLVLMDANHRYDPTWRYYNQLMKRIGDKTVFIIDDIYYSPEMTRAWNEIRKHELVYGSIDLYRCGLLFFDPALPKQHYVWAL